MIGVAGFLAFGLYVVSSLTPKTVDSTRISTLSIAGEVLSLKIISLLFGILVAGATILEFSGSSHLAFSSASKSRDIHLEDSNRMLQSVLTGILTIAFPSWIQNLAGLKRTVVGISVLQIVLSSSVGALFWTKGQEIRNWDCKVLKQSQKEVMDERIPIDRWKGDRSFFDS